MPNITQFTTLLTYIDDSIPAINKALDAIAKGTPEISGATLANGTKRTVYDDATDSLTFQILQNGNWVTITKSTLSVSTLGGYEPATSGANTIVVRDNNGKVVGDITGNANTATTAVNLSATLPVAKGGTGQTTVSGVKSYFGITSLEEQVSNLSSQTVSFYVQDGDGSTVTISAGKYIKFVEGGNIDINFTDTSTGSSTDPYDLTFTVPSASTSAKGVVQLSGDINESNPSTIQVPSESDVVSYVQTKIGSVTVPDATTTVKGIVQLSTATNSTATNLAATPSAVKSAYDLANQAQTTAESKANTTLSNITSVSSTFQNLLDNYFAETNLSNVTSISSSFISQLESAGIGGGVDYSIDVTSPISISGTYTTPSAGWIFAEFIGTEDAQSLSVDNVTMFTIASKYDSAKTPFQVLVSQGSVIGMSLRSGSTVKFYPIKGA